MPGWIQIITAAIALYGAGLATYTFYSNRRDRRRLLNVNVSYALAPHPITQIETLITITIANAGYHSVTVTGVSCELPDNQRVAYPNPRSDKPLPYQLQPGTNITILINAQELARTLTEAGYSGTIVLIGECSDAIGQTHRSESFDFDISTALSRH